MRGSIDQVRFASISIIRVSNVFCNTSLNLIFAVQVEGVIHFENDIEELQQWDHQVSSAFSVQLSSSCCACIVNSNLMAFCREDFSFFCCYLAT